MDLFGNSKSPLMRPCSQLLCVLVGVILLAGCGAPRYQATVWRTRHGIPHVEADNLGSVAFGQAYAFAQDHACILADQILKVRAERARYLGPGPEGAYIGSDFAYQLLRLHERAREEFPRLQPDVQEVIRGYAAGYNQYLADKGVANLPPLCAGAEWVQPINEVDLLAYYTGLAITGSSYPFLFAILNAQPPNSASKVIETPSSMKLSALGHAGVGSNAWGIGAERSATGRGMLLANPHFPWEGELRLWESHLVVPGQLDVYGASLMGMPAIQVGFNKHIAWTHTFTHGAQVTLYTLPLVPGAPTRYLYGGQEREMTARELAVQVRQPDGSLKEVRRTFYSSHYGPIVSLPGFEWNAQQAVSLRDPNIDNTAMVAQFLGMNRAKSMEEFQRVFATVQGAAFVNTVAVDREGNAWYINSSSTPNVSPEASRKWEEAVRSPMPSLQRVFYRNLGVPLWLLDGSKPENEWAKDPGARSPGLIPYSKAPQLSRRDFVFNANNPHWVANPHQLLEGYNPMYGLEDEAISPRARLNAVMLSEVREGGASGPDGKFTREELEAAVLGNRSFTAELLREQVVQRCRGKPFGTHKGQQIDISRACAVLEAWDGHYHVDSVGPLVWRELMGTYVYLEDVHEGGELFAVPFSPEDPVGTPHTLKPAPPSESDPLLDRLAQAVVMLQQANIPVDAPLGKAQFFPRGDRRFPIHGGGERDATLNLVTYEILNSSLQPMTPQGRVLNHHTVLTADGYVINTGSTFIMTLAFTDDGIDATGLLTYGQSEDPRSPHYNDQMELYVDRKFRRIVHSIDEVRKEPGVQKLEVRSP
jgi:acyl-homoserine-lactone acylase